ncbi:DUF167 domain-containing protein [Thermanaerothrix sp.]|jgi:uncharacterized protein YggU (UPF0235/DUF167 family)|uniref:DUF167 domain-containing protein n=1 Tax=Thermanaerothrix sp. TaxID=2972675 RepID=UPI002ADD3C20|nr:DUF167 domain-containing protein [Thermanaerothrix sp.]
MEKKGLPRFSQPKRGAALTLLVRGGANRDSIERITNDGIVVIALNAPATQFDQLNNALLAFLSGILGVKRTDLEIVAGWDNEQKLVAILGQDPEKVDQALRKALQKT